MRIALLIGLGLVVAACGDGTSPAAQPDLSTVTSPPDFAMKTGTPDLSMATSDDGPATSDDGPATSDDGPATSHDGPSPILDLAAAPDLKPAPLVITVAYEISTADLVDGTNNSFSVECGGTDSEGYCANTGTWCGVANGNTEVCVPPVTQINFYVQNVAGGAIATTSSMCTKGQTSDNADVKLPDASGPFNLWANVGAPNAKVASSGWVQPFTSDQSLYIDVFVCGCNYPQSGSDPACATAGM